MATFNTGLGSFHRCTIQTRLKTHEPHGLLRFDSVRVTRSKNRRLVPNTADSFQIRPTRSKNGRPWKKTAHSGNSDGVWLPDGMTRPRFSPAFRNALSSLRRRTYTNLWAPGWVLNSQAEKLQRFEEKSQEPIPMGSWLRTWPPSRRFSRHFETRSAVSGGLPCKETGPVFTAFRNAMSWVVVCCGVKRARAMQPIFLAWTVNRCPYCASSRHADRRQTSVTGPGPRGSRTPAGIDRRSRIRRCSARPLEKQRCTCRGG